MAEGDARSSRGRNKPVSTAARRWATATALVVDDHEPIRSFVATVLRRHGFLVLEAPDGCSAIPTLREHRGRLDLLVTDLQMPILNGVQVAMMVTIARPEAAVIIATGEPTALGEGGLGLGPVLRKPFTADELLAAVVEALADRHVGAWPQRAPAAARAARTRSPSSASRSTGSLLKTKRT